MRIINRIGIFLWLKLREIVGFINFIFTDKEVSPFKWIYIICYAVGLLSLVCVNNEWDGIFWASKLLEFTEPVTEAREASSANEEGLTWFSILAAFTIIIPLVGFMVIFSWAVLIVGPILLMIVVVGILWGIFDWLKSNWKEAGEILEKKENKE